LLKLISNLKINMD